MWAEDIFATVITKSRTAKSPSPAGEYDLSLQQAPRIQKSLTECASQDSMNSTDYCRVEQRSNPQNKRVPININ